ncbi:hypothetical protein [Antrihabitans spumae]|jgi:hypothetical protein|uniref:Uncharacterized protein n=1 Tax=Antrihabitans spumae TaxID=3373370 RepID=A0ABW7K5J3_9NOCA
MSRNQLSIAAHRYRVSWPALALISAIFSALILLHVTSPQAWVLALILVPLAVAPE